MTVPAGTGDLAGLVAHLAETASGLRVETGPGGTGACAHDASNYRFRPWAVAFPRTAVDVVAVVRVCSTTTPRWPSSAWR